MKVNDYIRTEYGIAKIIKIDNKVNACQIDIPLNDFTFVLNENIIKSSPNIIDLIEVGDILLYNDGSACRVLEITDNYYLLKGYVDDGYERKEWLECVDSIITKEQIEKYKYNILKGERNEL